MQADMTDSRRSIDAHLLDRLTKIETRLELWMKAMEERNTHDQLTTKDHEDRLRFLEGANYRYIGIIGFLGFMFALFKDKLTKIFQ